MGSQCNECPVKIADISLSNLKLHIKRRHPEILDKVLGGSFHFDNWLNVFFASFPVFSLWWSSHPNKNTKEEIDNDQNCQQDTWAQLPGWDRNNQLEQGQMDHIASQISDQCGADYLVFQIRQVNIAICFKDFLFDFLHLKVKKCVSEDAVPWSPWWDSW